MTPEGAVKKQIREWLTEHGAYHFAAVQMGMGTRTVDLLCCMQGRFIGIEVKRPGVLKSSKFQTLVIKEIINAGGIAFVTDSLDYTVQYLQRHHLGLYNPET